MGWLDVPGTVGEIVTNTRFIISSLMELHRKADRNMSSISESLATIKANLAEAAEEINAKLDSLDVVSDEDKAIVEELKTSAQALADIVPDATEVEPEEPIDEGQPEQ